jgi:type I restriction enzyme M protein
VKSDSWFKDADIFDKHESIKLRERSFEQIVKELEIYNLTSTSADVKGIVLPEGVLKSSNLQTAKETN